MEERGEFVGIKAVHGGRLGCRHGRLKVPDERGAVRRQGTEDLAAVRTAGSDHKPLPFKAIHQPGNSGGALEELFRNGERRQSSISGVRQNSQDIVLLERDSPRLQIPLDDSTNPLRNPEERPHHGVLS